MNDQSATSTGQSTASATGDSTGISTGIVVIEGREIIIDPDIKVKYTELLEMIKLTGSMTLDEKEYWIQLLPIMNNDQIKNLEAILGKEKMKLAEIDAKYSKKMENLSQNYINKWDSEKNKFKKQKRATEEAATEEEEKAMEEDLLSALE
jgi:hypothetical protein